MTIRIGIDLGGTKTEIIALDASGAVLLRRREPTPAHDYAAMLSLVARLVHDAERELGDAASATDAVREICGTGIVGSRITHVYPDGAAPYFTVVAPGRRASQLEQWDEVKAAVSEAILAAGGTITHHHAVGRDHRAGYDRERPELFAAALRAAKSALDPSGILNPGVLV